MGAKKVKRKRCSKCGELSYDTQDILGEEYCYVCFKTYKRHFEKLSWSWPTRIRKLVNRIQVNIYD